MRDGSFVRRRRGIAGRGVVGVVAALVALVAAGPEVSRSLAAQEPAGSEEERRVEEIRRHRVPEARQGPAVLGAYFYAVDNRRIAKYRRETGERVAAWQGPEDGPIVHLNAGIVIDGVLYAAHSNYPDVPMLSSIEMFDPVTLEHTGSHSFGFYPGSATWVDRKDGFWWVGFANYEGRGGAPGRPPSYTRVVKFDDDWNEVERFAFPPEVVERFGTRSNSGGSWGPDGRLYATGHDEPELYVLRLPEAGSMLDLVEIVPVPAEGQGIAWDRDDPGVLLTLLRESTEIVESRMTGWDGE